MISITNIIAFRGLRDSGGDSGGGGGASDTMSGGGGSDFSGGVGNDSLGSSGGGSGYGDGGWAGADAGLGAPSYGGVGSSGSSHPGFWSSLATDLGNVFGGTSTSPYSAADVSFANDMAATYGRDVASYLPGGQYGPGGGSYSSIGRYTAATPSESIGNNNQASALMSLMQQTPALSWDAQMQAALSPFSPSNPADMGHPFGTQTTTYAAADPAMQAAGRASDVSSFYNGVSDVNAAFIGAPPGINGPMVGPNGVATEAPGIVAAAQALGVDPSVYSVAGYLADHDPNFAPPSGGREALTAYTNSYINNSSLSNAVSDTEDAGSWAAGKFGFTSPVGYDPVAGWTEGTGFNVMNAPALDGLATMLGLGPVVGAKNLAGAVQSGNYVGAGLNVLGGLAQAGSPMSGLLGLNDTAGLFGYGIGDMVGNTPDQGFEVSAADLGLANPADTSMFSEAANSIANLGGLANLGTTPANTVTSSGNNVYIASSNPQTLAQATAPAEQVVASNPYAYNPSSFGLPSTGTNLAPESPSWLNSFAGGLLSV